MAELTVVCRWVASHSLVMGRHTTFRYCLDPTVEQQRLLDRHAGAARFAFNTCLGFVKSALTQRETDPDQQVPWTGFSLINAFNAWKKTEAAGRVISVDSSGVAEVEVTGLAWRGEVRQQVFEEAAIDCGRALTAFFDSRAGKRKGKRVGFPRFKEKKSTRPSFRLRNKISKSGGTAIRVGDNTIPRSVTLPGIGPIRVREDTRPLRRMLANGRAKILFTTVTYRMGRWQLSVTVEAADLHPALQHAPRAIDDDTGWVGIDRGLTSYLVAATSDGTEVARIDHPPKPLAAGLRRQRRLAKSLSRKQKGSRNRQDAAARLARHHNRVTNVRRHFLHQLANMLVKTHDRLVVEDLNVAGLLGNRRLARAIGDAGWADFCRILRYKQHWRGGTVVAADRWYPSSKRCSACTALNTKLTLSDRVYFCECGFRADRDHNAAINLAAWPTICDENSPRPPDPEARGRVTNVRRREGADQHPVSVGETDPDDAGTDVHTMRMV
ncbi:IS200/IS605 family element transposase accessory protein TnpB [Nocardia sp. ET3-3]|uniref:IS200/IS605 family element transposase accessory protein TnpB n=1 Tax=Nocardia terrae TaxID=2675851 RepID=A0A7K1VAR0_9NOCA|nr:RNA-guided endonuclease TnpB family protein [Nocardia terrae]MVU83502.1 IS200/IS605 family element transposase accessory protein TnpB [Nocardia terrae]